MTHGEQTLPINDLFVYLPVQLLPALVKSILHHGFQPAGGYRTRKEGAEDNPLLVVGVYSKEMAYGNEPQMPAATWAERAYTWRALDPSWSQSMSFPSFPQLKLRLEVPLWMNLAEARHPPMDTHLDESDADSGVTGTREPSPRYAQPVPVGAANPLELFKEESTEGDEAAADPTYVVPQGHGRFAIRYSRLATALGNFEKGNAQTESTVVAGWLTSGLEIATRRMGWNLLSTRKELTKLNREALYHHFHHGYPHCHEDDRPYQKYGNHACKEEEWDKLCYWLTGDPTFRSKVERRRRELREKITGARDESAGRHKAGRIAPPGGTGSSSSTARPPHRNQPPPPPPSRRWGP